MRTDFARLALILTTLALTACGGGGGAAASAPLPTVSPASAPTAAPVVTTLSLPTNSGYSGTVGFSASTPTGVSPTIGMTDVPPTTTPATPYVSTVAPVLQYIQITTPSATTYAQTPTISLTVPNTVITSEQLFHLAAYDQTQQVWIVISQPATISGQTLTFSPVVTTFTVPSTSLVLSVVNQ